MIHAEELTAAGPKRSRRAKFRVIRGGQEFDLERLADTLAMLENYVDAVLAAEELPAMDPWVDDQVMDVRLASL